jgi:hypothetical protein
MAAWESSCGSSSARATRKSMGKLISKSPRPPYKSPAANDSDDDDTCFNFRKCSSYTSILRAMCSSCDSPHSLQHLCSLPSDNFLWSFHCFSFNSLLSTLFTQLSSLNSLLSTCNISSPKSVYADFTQVSSFAYFTHPLFTQLPSTGMLILTLYSPPFHSTPFDRYADSHTLLTPFSLNSLRQVC